jgi:Lrp/AsnC family transcriptional regulator, regulator for asnA, asnC and gidA
MKTAKQQQQNEQVSAMATPHQEKVTLDALDKKILSHLHKDGRAMASSIAKHVRSSKEVVIYRMKRLTESGILQGIVPIVDYSKLGFQIYRLQLRLHSPKPSEEKKLISECKKLPHISWVVDLSGSWDLVLLFLSKNPLEFSKSQEAVEHLFGSHIEEKQISIVTQIEHYNSKLVLDTKLPPSIVGQTPNDLTLHQSEAAILKQLLTDGRASILDIATRTKMSATNATHHFKQLLHKKIVVGFKPVIQYEQFGLDHFKVMLSLKNPSQKHMCHEFMLQKVDIIYVTQSIGKFDVEFEALASSYRELLTQIESLKEQVHIHNFDIIITRKENLINDFVHESK